MTCTKGRASLLALALLLGSGVASAQDSSPAQLAALARDARSTREHAEVAKRYRLQADALDAKAAQQEKQAAAMARNAPGIVHKWPSMAPRALSQTTQQAIETRRAARESRELAQRHQRLAVESLAGE